MIWAYPATLWGLLLVPLFALLSWRAWRRSRTALSSISDRRIEWPVRSFFRDFSMAAFVLFIVLSAAEPRSGRQPVAGEQSGLDVVVAFDISRSMLATDMEPTRLDKSLAALRLLVSSLEDTRFALVPFKGDARLVVPMTEDRVMIDLWIDRLGPGLSTEPGSNLEEALRRGSEAFPPGEGRARALVLVSDGEALSGRLDRVSRELAEDGLSVHVLAVGSTEGSPILLGDGSYVKDSGGQPVVSRADLASLRRLAAETGGTFHELSRPGAAVELRDTIESMRDFSESRGISFKGINRYRFFLVPALFFLFGSLFARIVPWPRP